jgi:hypothetical protein
MMTPMRAHARTVRVLMSEREILDSVEQYVADMMDDDVSEWTV